MRGLGHRRRSCAQATGGWECCERPAGRAGRSHVSGRRRGACDPTAVAYGTRDATRRHGDRCAAYAGPLVPRVWCGHHRCRRGQVRSRIGVGSGSNRRSRIATSVRARSGVRCRSARPVRVVHTLHAHGAHKQPERGHGPSHVLPGHRSRSVSHVAGAPTGRLDIRHLYACRSRAVQVHQQRRRP